jgi:energy-coupling factor transporter ATP-binding protein EcfA2
MRIVKLVAENIKRLTAVEITPTGDLILIGGRNGAGKSSVLDAIMYALGGASVVPSEPIRLGETEACITVDLGDMLVTRKFTRTDSGETKSTVKVANKDGSIFPSPQAMLDKLLGRLTFDPLQFAHDDPKKQDATLRALVGLDTTLLDGKRKSAVEKRADLNRRVASAAGRLVQLPRHDGMPEGEIPLGEVSTEMRRAEELRRLASEAGQAVSKAKDALAGSEQRIAGSVSRIRLLKEQLEEATKELDLLNAKKLTQMDELLARQQAELAAVQAVPNVENIQLRLSEIEIINAKVRENRAFLEAKKSHAGIAAEVNAVNAEIEELDKLKESLLTSAKFPVDGLGISDDGVTFNGVPFVQASTAEQLRVSVAIGLALHPKLKVLLIRNGNALDEDSLRAVAEQAATADAQIWMEYVTKSAEGVSVLIEDGAVAYEQA